MDPCQRSSHPLWAFSVQTGMSFWLECAERSAQLDLPAKAAKLLKRHVMLLRGQVQALQWLSHGAA